MRVPVPAAIPPDVGAQVVASSLKDVDIYVNIFRPEQLDALQSNPFLDVNAMINNTLFCSWSAASSRLSQRGNSLVVVRVLGRHELSGRLAALLA